MTISTNIVDISTISHFLTTRERGIEAYKKFRPAIDSGSVVFDLDAAQAVSASFLDGLLLRLDEYQQLDRVSFRTSSERLRNKLRRLSADRSFEIYIEDDSGRRLLAPRQAPQKMIAKFSPSKLDDS